ncbi:MAG TPA: redox-sensing transcriptional repressor Rex [Candidatus Onthocola gallistercoris]|uniref:Redox-sensing transcriptional repressor Rex n=1 Tax=Candidatus Onthocola gallistercoris TaxID=2840876 RepID=A0A9D1HFB4_9FIRM|nr:redox-sensing transcriptional repressor Rex [Candidatus Onthocola gallistercoris]
MRKGEISKAVIRRLPRYYRYLGELLQNGVVRISSKELSERMKVTASQIRQDLNNFGGFGQQGYGYNVEYLHEEIGKILGLDVTHNMIIIGAGNLGQALANYNFEKVGFHLIGIFDINPRFEGVSVRGIEIQMLDTLEDFLAKNKVDVVTLTVPKRPAVDLAHHLVDLGIKAIWNFAPTDLNLSEDVCVKNVHLNESLMTLSYEYRAKHSGESRDV